MTPDSFLFDAGSLFFAPGSPSSPPSRSLPSAATYSPPNPTPSQSANLNPRIASVFKLPISALDPPDLRCCAKLASTPEERRVHSVKITLP